MKIACEVKKANRPINMERCMSNVPGEKAKAASNRNQSGRIQFVELMEAPYQKSDLHNLFYRAYSI